VLITHESGPPRDRLQYLLGQVLKLGRQKVLILVCVMIAVTAVADWSIGLRASLGVLYVFPMMLAVTVLTPVQTVCLAVLCAFLRFLFDLPSPELEVFLRFLFAVIAYSGSGLIVAALIRSRREQELRLEAEERLEALVESSPAAILTLDAAGRVIACNQAANALFFIPQNGSLKSRTIHEYLPLLADALRFDAGSVGLRTAAQCQGRRDNGEVFLAHCWFSSYATPHGRKLAAIVVDSSEEMREREEEGLRQLLRGNRIAAAAVAHEVRNLCTALDVVCSKLEAKNRLSEDEDFKAVRSLVGGLGSVASSDLQSRVNEGVVEVNLREVLDDLRIVIEPDWREIGGSIDWQAPAVLPAVLGERHGLLQSFLNLAQNSYRAVQECDAQRLCVRVSVRQDRVEVRFEDTGPGIRQPENLFAPFQSGADGTGLGLYVARAVVRSYGGDLRCEAMPAGACFCVELQIV
jgi:two-component system sensor kinase FixL